MHQDIFYLHVLNQVQYVLNPTGTDDHKRTLPLWSTLHTVRFLIGMDVSNMITDNPANGDDNPVMRTLQSGIKKYQQEARLNKKTPGASVPILLNTTFLQEEESLEDGLMDIPFWKKTLLLK